MIGGSQIKRWSKTQSTIALLSGEAELIGIGSGCAQGLGLQSLAADMGWKLKLSVHSDATAALGIAKRRGLGKIRHLHCTDLWIQERVRNGDVALHKVLGTENPADIFTKYVDANLMEKALNKQNMFFMEGRAKLAPDTMGLGKQSFQLGSLQMVRRRSHCHEGLLPKEGCRNMRSVTTIRCSWAAGTTPQKFSSNSTELSWYSTVLLCWLQC